MSNNGTGPGVNPADIEALIQIVMEKSGAINIKANTKSDGYNDRVVFLGMLEVAKAQILLAEPQKDGGIIPIRRKP